MKTSRNERKVYRLGIALAIYGILLTFINSFEYYTTHLIRGLSISIIIVFTFMLFTERKEEVEKEENKNGRS